jgi:hypothetical protein
MIVRAGWDQTPKKGYMKARFTLAFFRSRSTKSIPWTLI